MKLKYFRTEHVGHIWPSYTPHVFSLKLFQFDKNRLFHLNISVVFKKYFINFMKFKYVSSQLFSSNEKLVF